MPQGSYFEHSLLMTLEVRVNKLGYKPCEYMPQRSYFKHSLPMTKGGKLNNIGYISLTSICLSVPALNIAYLLHQEEE